MKVVLVTKCECYILAAASTATDVNFGECSNVKHIDACVLNTGEMYACISTTANPTASWGTKYTNNWTVPTMSAYTNNGIPRSPLPCNLHTHITF